MPSNPVGQMITFAAEIDPDSTVTGNIMVKARKGDTLAKIASRRGHIEWTARILALNKGRDLLVHPRRLPHKPVPHIPKLRTANDTLRTGAVVRLPGIMKAGEFLSVNAGNEPPVIKAGYAKYDIVNVPGRIGINRFLGYDPIAMDIPVQFENYGAQLGASIESDIQALERMAGRGDYPGAAIGPPAVIRVSVTALNAKGVSVVVPLIPPDYQWSSQHKHAPLWRISASAWDAGALRNDNGYRIRQTATVTVTQYTPTQYVVRSAAQRARQTRSKTTKKAA
ncbi:MAG TPA: hypothetical protein VGK33_19265 [Chloroflexota bacterium]